MYVNFNSLKLYQDYKQTPKEPICVPVDDKIMLEEDKGFLLWYVISSEL